MYKINFIKTISLLLFATFAVAILLSLVCPFPQMSRAMAAPSGAAFCQNGESGAVGNVGDCLGYHLSLLNRFSGVLPKVLGATLLFLFFVIAHGAAIWRKVVNQLRATIVRLRHYCYSSWGILKSRYEKKLRAWLVHTESFSIAFVV